MKWYKVQQQMYTNVLSDLLAAKRRGEFHRAAYWILLWWLPIWYINVNHFVINVWYTMIRELFIRNIFVLISRIFLGLKQLSLINVSQRALQNISQEQWRCQGGDWGKSLLPSYFNHRFWDFSKSDVESVGVCLLFKFLTGARITDVHGS